MGRAPDRWGCRARRSTPPAAAVAPRPDGPAAPGGPASGPASPGRAVAAGPAPRTSPAPETLLDAGILQGLLDPLALRGVGLEQALAIAGQVAQLTDRGRGHKAAPQQPMLQQLRQPGRVTDIGLAAGQDLDVAG